MAVQNMWLKWIRPNDTSNNCYVNLKKILFQIVYQIYILVLFLPWKETYDNVLKIDSEGLKVNRETCSAWIILTKNSSWEWWNYIKWSNWHLLVSVCSVSNKSENTICGRFTLGWQFEMYNIRDTEQEGVNLKVTKYSNVWKDNKEKWFFHLHWSVVADVIMFCTITKSIPTTEPAWRSPNHLWNEWLNQNYCTFLVTRRVSISV